MLIDNPALQTLKQGFNAEKVKKEGIVRGTERGFGFLEVPGDKNSYFIAPQAMKNVLSGDRIVALITEDKEKNKFQALPESLIETSLKDKFVGRVCFINNKLNITADNPSIKQTFYAEDHRVTRNHKLIEGDWVMCQLVKHSLTDGNFKVHIIDDIANKDDPKTPWIVSLRALSLPLEAPASLDDYPFLESSFPREDLTNLPFVTIDSEKTEDMDDALYIEKVEDGYDLFIAIADPTGYIDEKSDLNEEASKRAFSIYLPGRNIPMLPRKMSDDLCSLREGEERPALVGIVHILPDGDIATEDTVFKLATIKSQGKLIYNYVSDFLENGDTSNFNPNETVKKVLADLVEMTKLRDHYRSTVTASFRTRPDYEFVLSDDGSLDHIEVNHRRIANQIVEESMIAANIACGDFLAENLNTGIFNAHAGFTLETIEDVVELLHQNGFDTTSEQLKTIEGFCAARRFANGLTSTYLDNMLRRYQEYSQMTINPAPHYALGVENYATWTSPIRKYGDMINHRLIKFVICEQEHPTMPDETLLTIMNQARRTNRLAERLVREWLYVDYLADDVTKATVFNAEVFDIVRGGLRVSLLDNGAFVFIPISLFSSEKDNLEFSMTTGQILYKGEPILRLGDAIKVRLVSIDKENRSIVGTPVELPADLPLPNIEEVMQKRLSQQNQNRNAQANRQMQPGRGPARTGFRNGFGNGNSVTYNQPGRFRR